ncbi:hypothetical protein HMPREF1548_04871 [Clostridium sp. KLE 1755]|nr:hypothetical protein HMPREF1548_04871 [Clostridium sp. KLE 1755]
MLSENRKTGRRREAGGSQAVSGQHGPEKYPGLPHLRVNLR